MDFLTHSELVEKLPWSRSMIDSLVAKRIFKPIKNPFKKTGGKRFYLKSQVEQAILMLMNDEGETK